MSDIPQGPKKIPGMKGAPSTEEEVVEVPEQSKLLNFLACVCYVCLLGGMGTMLSLYHLFLWDSTEEHIIPDIDKH